MQGFGSFGPVGQAPKIKIEPSAISENHIF